MQDNACFGFETYYSTHYSLELRYYIDPYAFYEYETLDRNVPSAGFENSFGWYGGFSDKLFYTHAKNWDDLAKGIVFYRF